MATARETYNASVVSASSAKVATVTTNQTAHQTAIDASLSVVGYTLQSGNYATLATTVAKANRDAVANRLAAAQAEQAAQALARDTLRGTGDKAPF